MTRVELKVDVPRGFMYFRLGSVLEFILNRRSRRCHFFLVHSSGRGICDHCNNSTPEIKSEKFDTKPMVVSQTSSYSISVHVDRPRSVPKMIEEIVRPQGVRKVNWCLPDDYRRLFMTSPCVGHK